MSPSKKNSSSLPLTSISVFFINTLLGPGSNEQTTGEAMIQGHMHSSEHKLVGQYASTCLPLSSPSCFLATYGVCLIKMYNISKIRHQI